MKRCTTVIDDNYPKTGFNIVSNKINLAFFFFLVDTDNTFLKSGNTKDLDS